jgi:hypothetical protein
MSFTPTTAQLELLAELEMARMPVALIADRLGVDVATFKAGPRAWMPQAAILKNRHQAAPRLCASFALVELGHELRVIAEHMFECD